VWGGTRDGEVVSLLVRWHLGLPALKSSQVTSSQVISTCPSSSRVKSRQVNLPRLARAWPLRERQSSPPPAEPPAAASLAAHSLLLPQPPLGRRTRRRRRRRRQRRRRRRWRPPSRRRAARSRSHPRWRVQSARVSSLSLLRACQARFKRVGSQQRHRSAVARGGAGVSSGTGLPWQGPEV
jgi:hypothetical protein